ncbi:MAG TPA: alpha/beta hydrolase-fold protein [Amaricoccus sp.]|uniref:esterase family protein n=1 Tax=Amaricoccus sp. TaxID=1872485 RepID=UPI002C54CE0C|nr:alpha/beta hydrolase-fold protein [Amaricoccus sp.]HMQ95282.1 alpha/beta hydrolase-fold protein [Amaricoccus sp.]HMR54908.1 alpha/beta hydrolase-fold protein [Amaricoccus sp.]HMR62125.1 alpha/beta hydrolase-fold protein [Amaricoccus sp.]HMU01893.1 alpha/beta hydrolase-fold protein [Amaricoccus sp.]
MKTASRWFSPRIEQEISLVRWGHWGQPVLLFPTAGGDAEEVERMHLIGALGPLIEAGRIKVYSCDSLAGRALASKTGSPEYRCKLLNRFEECVAEEIVPAIRTDCSDGGIEIVAAGASIGAFKALAVACRYPWAFRAAIGMSGTYDLESLLGFRGTEDYYFSAPIAFLPNLGPGPMLDALRRRFVILAYGQGRWENPEESWRLANVLGAKGIPNRVDPWGPEYDHDWPSWRAMLPVYLDEIVA